MHPLYLNTAFNQSIQNPTLCPGQTEHLSTMSGDTYLGLSIGTLNTSRDLLALPLQNDLVTRSVGQLVEASSVTAEEVLKLLLGNVRLRDDATLNGFFEAKKNELHDIGLSENTRRCLPLLGRCLRLQWVGSAIASTVTLSVNRRDLLVEKRLTRRTWCCR